MKAKEFFELIDAKNNDEIREDSVMYRNAFEAILALKDGLQLDVFRWFFAYSLYGIEPKFDEKLTKNRQNKASIEFIFSLVKKQRIGWEKSKNQRDRHSDPMGGDGGGTPHTTLSHTRDKQVSKDTSISNDIQVPIGTSPIGQDCLFDKSEIYSSASPTNNIPWNEIVDFFNKTTNGYLGKIRLPFSDKRKASVRARINDYGLETFYDVIRKAAASRFLTGDNKQNWAANFDWIIRPTNFEKVMSGNYDNKNEDTESGFEERREKARREAQNNYQPVTWENS